MEYGSCETLWNVTLDQWLGPWSDERAPIQGYSRIYHAREWLLDWTRSSCRINRHATPQGLYLSYFHEIVSKFSSNLETFSQHKPLDLIWSGYRDITINPTLSCACYEVGQHLYIYTFCTVNLLRDFSLLAINVEIWKNEFTILYAFHWHCKCVLKRFLVILKMILAAYVFLYLNIFNCKRRLRLKNSFE